MSTISTTVLSDNAYGTIASSLAVGDTALAFTTGHGARFPVVASPNVMFCCLLNAGNVLEEIQITAHASGSDAATIVRGVGGTSAKAWSAGDRIEARVSNAALDGITSFIQSGTGAIARTSQDKARDVVSVLDFMTTAQISDVRGSGALDVSAAVQAAINAVDTSGGKGGTVVGPAGVYNIGATTITGRTNVRVQFAGRRASIINYSGTGSAFQFDGTTLSGLSGVRISPGVSATAVALDIKTTSADVTECEFDDLEIAGANTAGQIGIQAVVSGGHIISENIFSRIFVTGIDKSIVKTSCEGNQWYGIVIANFGNGASPVAINSTTCHNDWMHVRVAGIGAGVTTPIAYQETGDRSYILLSADIGATGKAVNSSGSRNIFVLTRAVDVTPVGTYGILDVVIDASRNILQRIGAGGTAMVAGDFVLSAGWGTTATVSNVTANDQRGEFTVTSTGTGQSANPTIQLNFKDGNWTTAPFVVIGRTNGNQFTTTLWQNARNVNNTLLIFTGTPVAGEAYGFTFMVMG